MGNPGLDVVHKDDTDNSSEKEDRLKEAAKDAVWFMTGLVNEFVSHVSGINPVAAGALAEKKKGQRKNNPPDFIKIFGERKASLKKLKETLRDIFNHDHPKAFIFVDELDRCRPDYAIAYLETIKHIFDVHGLVFVLAADYEQLSYSARALFGGDLNVAEYLRKFIQRTVVLPEPEQKGLEALAQQYAPFYLEPVMHFDGRWN